MANRFLTLFLLALVAGCAKPSLVGTWTGSTTVMGQNASSETTFNDDGTFSQVTLLLNDGKGLKATDSGTWKYNEGVLDMDLVDVSWKAVGTTPEVGRKIEQMLQKDRAKIIAEVNQEPDAKVTWVSPDDIKLVYPDREESMKRKR